MLYSVCLNLPLNVSLDSRWRNTARQMRRRELTSLHHWTGSYVERLVQYSPVAVLFSISTVLRMILVCRLNNYWLSFGYSVQVILLHWLFVSCLVFWLYHWSPNNDVYPTTASQTALYHWSPLQAALHLSQAWRMCLRQTGYARPEVYNSLPCQLTVTIDIKTFPNHPKTFLSTLAWYDNDNDMIIMSRASDHQLVKFRTMLNWCKRSIRNVPLS